MKLYYQKIFEDSKAPEKAYETDSGWDVFVHSFVKRWSKPDDGNDIEIVTKYQEFQDVLVLEPNDRVLINTGLKLTYGVGYEIQVRPRSGLAGKQGLQVVNSPGTIDESYRGMAGILIKNGSNVLQTINKEDKIAQLVVAHVVLSEAEEVKELPETKRGEDGFGSTGKK